MISQQSTLTLFIGGIILSSLATARQQHNVANIEWTKETNMENNSCNWYFYPTHRKCVHGSAAVGLITFDDMEACCLQSFGEDEPCDWHDKCSSTVSNNLRGQTINRISPSKNKFVAYDEFTGSDHGGKSGKSDGGAKSGKSKSDKSSGAKAGKATQPSCSSTQLVVVRDNLNLLIPETGTQGSTEPVILPVTDDCTIEDITVEIRIDHTFASDLEIDLVSPDSETATLVDQQGDNPSSSSPIIFNDNTGVSLTGGFTAGGTYISQGEKNGVVNNMLSNITGGTFGNWTLNIFDDQGMGTGTLQAVNLTIDAICCA